MQGAAPGEEKTVFARRRKGDVMLARAGRPQPHVPEESPRCNDKHEPGPARVLGSGAGACLCPQEEPGEPGTNSGHVSLHSPHPTGELGFLPLPSGSLPDVIPGETEGIDGVSDCGMLI